MKFQGVLVNTRLWTGKIPGSSGEYETLDRWNSRVYWWIRDFGQVKFQGLLVNTRLWTDEIPGSTSEYETLDR
jgi:hypothetical protein